jgi:broad specificity phosphatase PhoE
MNSFLSVFLLLSAPSLLVSFVLDSKVKTRSPLPTTLLSKESEDANPTTKQFPTLVVSEMPAPLPDKLKNHYYFLRHGQSTANVAEVISSDRSLAYSDRHGVTPLGYEQGFQSATQLLDILSQEELQPGDKVLFVQSPFARARQTAQACLDGLAEQDAQKRIQELGIEILPDVVFEDRLMERYFGRLDNEAIYTYAYVWPLDGFNVTHTAFGVESVAAVCTRLSQVVDRFESEYDQGHHHIVWVSHADVLQIGQLYGANAENVGIFSSYRFKNGEVRAMNRTPDSLPEPDPLPAPQRGTGM